MPAARPVAYLVNQYPKVSHTFIRREIQALERRGMTVVRFAVRGWDAEVADPADAAERTRTRYLLERGLGPLAVAALSTLFGRPASFMRALGLAWRMAGRGDRRWPYHLVYLAEACLLRRWLDDAGCAHLHAHFGTNPAEVAMLVRALGGPPYSFTVHGPEEFDRPEALGLAEKTRHAAFVVAISSFGRSQLYRWIDHADWPRVHVVHCGLDPSFHAAALSAPASGMRLVCVGRLTAQKGPLFLLEAAAVVRRRGIPLELVLVGDGELRPDVERMVESLDMREHVRITGWVGSDAVRREIEAARALILPSFAEGLPVVLMEAMALGRPVISTYVAGIPELVRDAEDGWLVPPGDVDALVAAIERCLEADPARIEAMGDGARRRALERHDVDVEAGKLAALFASTGGSSA